MRYNLLFGQSITVYSIIFMISRFIKCNEICTKPELKNFTKVIFENDSYKYSHNYYYSQLIRLNQSPPVSNDRFGNVYIDEFLVPAFLIKVYGNDADRLSINFYGTISMFKGELVGGILNFLKRFEMSNLEILNEKELLAIRLTYHKQDNGENFTFKVTSLIYPNGKIAFYYDEVAMEFRKDYVVSWFTGAIKCGKNGDYKSAHVKVPKKWIQSGTLVELEVLGDCSKHNSINTCEDAKTPDKTCIWCEKSDICTASNNEDNDDFKINGCQVETVSNVNVKSEGTQINQREITTGITEPDLTNELTKITESTESHLSSSIVDASIEPTLTNHRVTTTGITEPDLTHELTETTQTTKSHLNKTTGTTENREERESKSSLYIVIPLVVVFFVVCIGCAICLWLYRRKKSNP
uniref:Egg protein CP391S-like protein n=1 Tax=Schistosoma mansoni TaxID=6183 RepID=A0A5K4F9A2_SCHMA